MVFIFDSHPVQYKAPVYQRLQQLKPGSFKVIYATDSTMRGHHDREFGKTVIWDQPLLEGYPFLVLNNERGIPLTDFRSLTGSGIHRFLQEERPAAVIISQFIYEFDLVTYLSCLQLHIPIWIRQETQDEAFVRPAWKQALRGLIYRLAYCHVQHAFYFGDLNRRHLLHHGFTPERLTFAPYSTPIGTGIDASAAQRLRAKIRAGLEAAPNEIVLLFAGKLIDKKNPHLIFDALELLSDAERSRFRLVFIGSGALEASLRARAEKSPDRVHFAGFVNQSAIAGWYFAADIFILPSRRAGETWGLAVNEALQAGCAVIMSNAVGCYPEFGQWERVRVIPDNDAPACATALREVAAYPRSLDWCAERMKRYSINATAAALARQIATLDPALQP
ncbi:MAG TPA: glycosyltransferase family 4 protein [Candidatus Methylacidiphilales bacterium]|nr:glycosyltransferase family 4 protein [Candidatus Methylacidiphilales bacterium]